ncbi:MAG: A/G-specific adenine glycosylase [Candidatus Hydrogenedentota bacterium]|nr:MAG: A/G-specific adenine glycosylase [Candidatus Hydrogenedentota bacterium]
MDFEICARKFGLAIARWFHRNARDLPWRRKRNPYEIWIAEVMLQQTVVATVVPRFRRWMKRFPNLESLAQASEREVLREWEGLGYYARARNLHAAARRIVVEFRGKIPEEPAALRTLPGIGDYTAAAVGAIAFGRPNAVIDANVRRVLSRIRRWRKWNGSREESARRFLEAAMDSTSPAAFVEGLMELGETICRPMQAECDPCPVGFLCRSRGKDWWRFPERRRTSVTVLHTDLAVVVDPRKNVFLVPSDSGRFKGLRVFPALKERNARRRREEVEFLVGQEVVSTSSMKPRVHAYTRYRDHLKPVKYLVKDSGNGKTGKQKGTARAREKGGCWYSREEARGQPLPSVMRKILDEAFST